MHEIIKKEAWSKITFAAYVP